MTLTAVLESGTELDEVLALVNRQALSPYLGSASTREGIAIQLADVFAASDWRWRVYEQLPAPLQITDWRTTHGNLYSAIQLSRDLVGMILFIVILVAAFNVVSSLMLVVTDRRRAVAMLMAMGGRGADLTAVFFLQGGLIGLVGALAGVLGMAISTPDGQGLEWHAIPADRRLPAVLCARGYSMARFYDNQCHCNRSFGAGGGATGSAGGFASDRRDAGSLLSGRHATVCEWRYATVSR